MTTAFYARVSTTRQQLDQTIDEQLERLHTYCLAQGWAWREEVVFTDDGWSGATLCRPGLDRLRDQVARGVVSRLILTAPDRLARNYVHQMVLLEEFAQYGCQVDFLERPISQDPHDHLLLQIRGAVAEYERTLISERMRRGRQQKYRAGLFAPVDPLPFGYRSDLERPRDLAGVFLDPSESAMVAEIFAWYLEEGVSVVGVAKRLTRLGISSPSGKSRWSSASVTRLLRNPVYRGEV